MPVEHNCQPVFILGPTGTGKTELALEIARQLPREIISVDSVIMVYQGMKTGTTTRLLNHAACGTAPVLLDHWNRLPLNAC